MATGIAERYAREWLEQQAVTEVLQVLDPRAPARERQYLLPKGAAHVLTARDSLDYLVPIVQLGVAATKPIEKLLEAYRTGGGVPYADYGDDLREGQADMNRVAFLQLLGREWLPAIGDVHARLSSATPARVADFGCGYGWSSIGIALAYPNVLVDGFDLDLPSIEKAREKANEMNVADRVNFHHRDAGDPELSGRYDLVIALECVHDMGKPVQALRTMGNLAGDDGAVIIVDERVADEFMGPGNDLEWLMYGCSIVHCLPVGIADCDGHNCAATGTVMRTPTLRRYARQAGFSRVEVLPIENYLFRFYRLHQE